MNNNTTSGHLDARNFWQNTKTPGAAFWKCGSFHTGNIMFYIFHGIAFYTKYKLHFLVLTNFRRKCVHCPFSGSRPSTALFFTIGVKNHKDFFSTSKRHPYCLFTLTWKKMYVVTFLRGQYCTLGDTILLLYEITLSIWPLEVSIS